MTFEKLHQLSKEASESQKELKLMRDIIKLIKDEEIKPYYLNIKEDVSALDEDFQNITVNGFILQERKNISYLWHKEFYEEAIGCGIIHTLVKPGNKLKDRFDLSEYILPRNSENKSLGFSPPKKSKEENEEYNLELRIEKQKWSIDNEIERVLENYAHLKKLIELKEAQYEAIKKKLLNYMKENNINKTEEGFYLKDEPETYDFSKLYNAELEETVLIATNGNESVDLYYDKEIVMVDMTEDDLYEVEYIKKRFGAKRMEALKQALGNDFYFIKGLRTESNILSRFPVSTEKVEEAIDKGWLPMNVLKTGRKIKSIDHINLSFEIISEEKAKKRAEVNYQKFMNRALKNSGYYDIKE